jgi:hypothetical protein
MSQVEFSALVGKKIAVITGLSQGSEEVIITCVDGSSFRMRHYQDCCESVVVEDVVGDINDIIGSDVRVAEESTSETDPEGSTVDTGYRESFTWTFYKIDTAKGGITIRWYGSSNGYYSESVDFEQVSA